MIASLVDAVWPDGDPPARAGHDVRTYVHRLRSALSDDGGRIETVGAGYRLRLDGDDVDVARFERFADFAMRAAETGDVAGALEHADRAEQEWREPPLGEFEHESWAVPTAVRLRERHAGLRECRAAALIELDRPSEAVEALAALIHGEPLRERPRALLMQALFDTGRRAEALRAFRDYRRFLADEMGVEPSDGIVALDRAIARGDVAIENTRRHRRIGSYELGERIGEGTFAVVHRAGPAVTRPGGRREGHSCRVCQPARLHPSLRSRGPGGVRDRAFEHRAAVRLLAGARPGVSGDALDVRRSAAAPPWGSVVA